MVKSENEGDDLLSDSGANENPNERIHTEGIQAEGNQAEGIYAEGIQAEGIHAEGIHAEGIHAEGIYAPTGCSRSTRCIAAIKEEVKSENKGDALISYSGANENPSSARVDVRSGQNRYHFLLR